MVNLVAPFPRLGSGPDQNNRTHHGADWSTLRNHEQARARFSSPQACTEMSEHSPVVMRYQDPAFQCHSFEKFRITDAFQAGFDSRSKINARLSLGDRSNNGIFEIGVRLEANAQARGSPIFARARSSFSQSAGSACCNGMALPSNSRSVWTRYSSISAWWSK